MPLTDYTQGELLGEGGYAKVYRATHNETSMQYALKIMDKPSQDEFNAYKTEAHVLNALNSPYIIGCKEVFVEQGRGPPQLFIVTELARMGDLAKYIKLQKEALQEDLIWKIFIQVLLGLHAMHSRNILHRDIKPSNIFLDHNLNVKLGDMGVARVMSTQTMGACTMMGTPPYMSPEMSEGVMYDGKTDIWGLGVLLYECCTRRLPFKGPLEIIKGSYPPMTGCNEELCELVKLCLQKTPGERPSTTQLLERPAIKRYANMLGLDLTLVVGGAGGGAAAVTGGRRDRTVRPAATNEERDFLAACEASNLDRMRQLLTATTQPINPNVTTEAGGLTALHVACFTGNVDVVKELLKPEYGTNSDAADRAGETPLHKACTQNQLKVVRLLVAAGANKDAQDQGGDVPLHKAAAAGSRDAVDALLNARADGNIRNKAGQSPLDVARRCQHKNIVQLMREHDCEGASVCCVVM